ncbi:MAG: 5-bromo-4-chloroindolyl phosphate hydrolysis family protein, partial [Oscillospiraceae bacterium]|nr:5-bromo-4-chloroindolyl phosphate hydrolysis family protein [Oscillospiraceae bacterium]
IDPDCGYLSIYELADRVHRPYKQVCEDLQKMIDMRTWDAAWLDLQRGRLMLTPYDPDEEAPAADTVQEAGAAKSAAEQVLQQIRADNDLIADPEISRKIDRIETLTGKIFDYLEKHPERAGELQTFMDYYLPQTLKTLETYARLEAEGIETDSIRQAKAKISGILDKLCDGYEKQLDKLFQTDAMDITADIAVMEQMLKKDGLTEDEFAFEIKGK